MLRVTARRMVIIVPMISVQLIDETVQKIVTALHPRRIVIFGSHARGDAGPDSDLDLFVEMDSELSPPERAVRVARLFPRRDWPLDVVVYTPTEVTRLRGIGGTLLDIIEREGRVVYDGH